MMGAGRNTLFKNINKNLLYCLKIEIKKIVIRNTNKI